MSIVQPQPQPSEATKKVGSDGEEYSDTTIESPNFEVNTIISGMYAFERQFLFQWM